MSGPHPINLKEKARKFPASPGVYMMKDRLGRVLYVGKAKDLRRRVSSYLQGTKRTLRERPKIRSMIPLIRDLEVIPTRNETEAVLLEGRLIKQYRPRYNTDFTDDKRFLLVRMDPSQDLPRFQLVRTRHEDSARYFGPFAQSGLLRTTLAQMRRQFGILLGDASPVAQEDGTYLLYNDVRREIYGHSNRVTRPEYLARVEAASDFLEGKSRKWLEDLEQAMQEAARQKEFEKAARLRDAVMALRQTLIPSRKFTRRMIMPRENAAQVLLSLRQHLHLEAVPAVIECFDISHISGSFCVASMVQFRDGKPARPQYRRFHIKTFVGNDDFRAMTEVVQRRYQRLQRENRPFPDLILVDGGKGQVRAALQAFLYLDLPAPPLVGIAKKEETLCFPDLRPDLKLEERDSSLQLLQFIRDEAHRLANSFNATLRSRKLRESLLDEFPAIGPVRRKALMERFRSMDRLGKASVNELLEVAGIGPKLAADLRSFLDTHLGPLTNHRSPES